MTRVARGARLALQTPDLRIPLRALADRELTGDWTLPVLALAPAVTQAQGDVDVVTDTGVVTLAARLLHDDGLVLRPAGGAAVVGTVLQRRQDVRGTVELPLRAAVLDARGRPELADVTFDGATLTVSAGGLSLAPEGPGRPALHLPTGARLFLELELPDDVLVPAVLSLVGPPAGPATGAANGSSTGLRGAFVDIAAADRERLVRLVFAEQRRELAARRRARQAPRT